MKQISNYYNKMKALTAVIILSSLQQVFAQDKVEVNGHDVGLWFSSHWVWIAGAIVLLIIILLIATGGSTRRNKSTTIVKDSMGNVKSVTTTERND
jgi:formate-dependent nitrite reductase membrane component NrfD